MYCILKKLDDANTLAETTKFLTNLGKEYYCPFCEIMGIKFEAISLEILETHAVNRHKGCNIFHQPDIDKFKAEYEAKRGRI